MRLKASKTSLYKLVADFTPLPGIRRVDFIKAFLSVCAGRPVLSITVRDVDGSQISNETRNLSVDLLRDRGMVEEFTSAAERRRANG